MPMADTYTTHGRLVRALIYGKDKTKKTWWSLKAAEAGYNVILLDGDDGSSIVTQLPLEARKRILIVNAVNTRTRAVFALFMASFMKPGNDFLWDEEGKCSLPILTKRQPHKSYIRFQPDKLCNNDVVIIDSWTALAASTLIQFCLEQGIDLSTVEKDEDQFAHFNFQARYLDHILNQIHALPCHVIVIGHEQTWEQMKGKGKDRKVVATFTQPISSTGPQGQKLGKHFSEVLHFSKLSDTAYRINTGGDETKAGGSRTLAPQIWKWEEVTPRVLFEAVGAKARNEPCAGAIFLAPGEELILAKSNTTNTQAVEISKQVAETPAQVAVTAQPLVLNAEKGLSRMQILLAQNKKPS